MLTVGVYDVKQEHQLVQGLLSLGASVTDTGAFTPLSNLATEHIYQALRGETRLCPGGYRFRLSITVVTLSGPYLTRWASPPPRYTVWSQVGYGGKLGNHPGPPPWWSIVLAVHPVDGRGPWPWVKSIGVGAGLGVSYSSG